jgi:hypothetical protein
MANPESTAAPATTTQQTTAAKTAARVQQYADLVSPAVGAAKVGLKLQLENGAKNRLTFGS